MGLCCAGRKVSCIETSIGLVDLYSTSEQHYHYSSSVKVPTVCLFCPGRKVSHIQSYITCSPSIDFQLATTKPNTVTMPSKKFRCVYRYFKPGFSVIKLGNTMDPKRREEEWACCNKEYTVPNTRIHSVDPYNLPELG